MQPSEDGGQRIGLGEQLIAAAGTRRAQGPTDAGDSDPQRVHGLCIYTKQGPSPQGMSPNPSPQQGPAELGGVSCQLPGSWAWMCPSRACCLTPRLREGTRGLQGHTATPASISLDNITPGKGARGLPENAVSQQPSPQPPASVS